MDVKKVDKQMNIVYGTWVLKSKHITKFKIIYIDKYAQV